MWQWKFIPGSTNHQTDDQPYIYRWFVFVEAVVSFQYKIGLKSTHYCLIPFRSFAYVFMHFKKPFFFHVYTGNLSRGWEVNVVFDIACYDAIILHLSSFWTPIEYRLNLLFVIEFDRFGIREGMVPKCITKPWFKCVVWRIKARRMVYSWQYCLTGVMKCAVYASVGRESGASYR